VYEAEDLKLGRHVVLKFPPDDHQTTCLPGSLGHTFDSHQFHRITLLRHVAAPHRVMPEDVLNS